MANRPVRVDSGERVHPEDCRTLCNLKAWTKRGIFACRLVPPGQSVLDVACGTGRWSHYLVKKGANMVVGGDIAESAIDPARERYSTDRLHFLVLDGQALPFQTGSFDVVLSLETIEHVKAWRQFLAECRRVLKSGGVFICSTPNFDGHFFLTKAVLMHRFLLALLKRMPPLYRLLINPFHHHEFSEREFRAAIAEYFTLVELYGYRWGIPNLPPFSQHPGSGPIILEACKLFILLRRLFVRQRLVSFDQLDNGEEFIRDLPEPFPLGKKASYCDGLIAIAKVEAD